MLTNPHSSISAENALVDLLQLLSSHQCSKENESNLLVYSPITEIHCCSMMVQNQNPFDLHFFASEVAETAHPLQSI
jgi:hypothetical protein